MKISIKQLKRVIAEAAKAQSKWNPRTKEEFKDLLLQNGFKIVDVLGRNLTLRNEPYDVSVNVRYVNAKTDSYSLMTSSGLHLKSFNVPWTAAQYVQKMLVNGKFAHEGATLVCIANRGSYGCKFDAATKTMTTNVDQLIRTTEGAPIFINDMITIAEDNAISGVQWVEHNGTPCQLTQQITRNSFAKVSSKSDINPPKEQDVNVYVECVINSPHHVSYGLSDVIDSVPIINALDGCRSAHGSTTTSYYRNRNPIDTFSTTQSVHFTIDRSFNVNEFMKGLFDAITNNDSLTSEYNILHIDAEFRITFDGHDF